MAFRLAERTPVQIPSDEALALEDCCAADAAGLAVAAVDLVLFVDARCTGFVRAVLGQRGDDAAVDHARAHQRKDRFQISSGVTVFFTRVCRSSPWLPQPCHLFCVYSPLQAIL
jgi:hypothetical protein